MALSVEQFQEIMDDDVLVDKEKLIAGAKYGVPESVRSRVWMYLLNISVSSHHFEIQQMEEREKYYHSLRPTSFFPIKNSVNTVIHQMQLTELNISVGVSNILCNYFSCDPNISFTPGIVSLTVPLYLAANRDEVSAFFMLSNLLDRISVINDSGDYLKQSGKLAKYINIFYPELANHFSSEALDTSEVFVPWFQYLHSTAFPIPTLLRLWDAYLSYKVEDLMKHMLFVSLAVIDRLSPKIMRMEHLEIKNFLTHLPPIDVDVLLVQAQTIRHQFQKLFASKQKASHLE